MLVKAKYYVCRYLKGSPTGLMPSTMCRLARTRSIRKAYIDVGVSSIAAFLAASARELRTYVLNKTINAL